ERRRQLRLRADHRHVEPARQPLARRLGRLVLRARRRRDLTVFRARFRHGVAEDLLLTTASAAAHWSRTSQAVAGVRTAAIPRCTDRCTLRAWYSAQRA